MTVEEWIKQYKTKSDNRYPTFKKAFELLHERDGKNIVETGCVRMIDDWGAGMSTFLFGEYARLFGGHVWTVDIEPKNMDVCRAITAPNNEFITYTVDDSLRFLRDFKEPIDLLYLDSMDYPIDGNHEVELQSQNHQLSEMQIAGWVMTPGGLVLLDDNDFPGGGKTKLTKMFLSSTGWKEIISGQQSLWSKI